MEFQQEEDSTNIPGHLVDTTFTAIGLSPATLYTFRVAGVTVNGTGPYTDITLVTTEDGSMSQYYVPEWQVFRLLAFPA